MSLEKLGKSAKVKDTGPAGIFEGWNEESPLLSGRRGHASASDGNGLIYAIAGDDGTTRESAIVEQYDPATDTVTSVASLNKGRRRLAAVSDGSGNLYAIGGVTSSSARSASVEKYDPSSDTWTIVSSLATGRKNHAAAFPDDGNVYAIGGNTDATFTESSVEKYDPNADSWSSATSLNTGRRGLAATADGSSNIFAAGGISSSNDPTSVVEKINTSNDPNTVSTVSSLPTARTSLGANLADDINIRFIGGDDSSGRSDQVDIYDPVFDSYSNGATLPAPRNSVACASDNNNVIFSVGGSTSADSTSNTVLRLALSRTFSDAFTASGDVIVVLDDGDGILKNKDTGRISNPNVASDGEKIQFISGKSSRVTRI